VALLYKFPKSKAVRVIALYGITFFLLLFFYKKVPKQHKQLIQTIYTFAEYSFFTILILFNIENKKIRRFIFFASLGFLVFQVVYFFQSKLVRLDSVPIGIETILIFFFIVCYFFEFDKKASPVYVYEMYIFWISVGILLYLGGSFFFYILINHLNPAEIDEFGNLTYVAEIIKNVMFSVAIAIYMKHRKENVDSKIENVPHLDIF